MASIWNGREHWLRGSNQESDDPALMPAGVVRYRDELGVAFILPCPVGNEWRAGNAMIFWQNGDVTTISDDCELVSDDLWSLLRPSPPPTR